MDFEATYEGRVVGVEAVSIGVSAVSIGRAASGEVRTGVGEEAAFFLVTTNFLGLLGRYWERNFFLTGILTKLKKKLQTSTSHVQYLNLS